MPEIKGAKPTTSPVSWEDAWQSLVLCLALGLVVGNILPYPWPEGGALIKFFIPAAVLFLEMSGGSTLHLLTMFKSGDFYALSYSKKDWYFQRDMDWRLTWNYRVFAVLSLLLEGDLLTIASSGRLAAGLLLAVSLCLGVIVFTFTANRPYTKDAGKNNKTDPE